MSRGHFWRHGAVAVIATATAIAIGAGAPARADAADNSGHVWITGTPAGNQAASDAATETHVVPAEINVWGRDLAGDSGSFTVSAIDPTAATASSSIFTGSWTYTGSGPQVIDSFNSAILLGRLALAGVLPAENGYYHLELTLNGDPSKSVTFWLQSPS